MTKITYREALNQALSEEIERDENVVLMGEEVAQFKGSYKVSEGMLERFGNERIIDTPISEAAFSGACSWSCDDGHEASRGVYVLEFLLCCFRSNF